MIELINFAKWTMGAFLVAFGAVAFGYGGGMMYRAWIAQQALLSGEISAPLQTDTNGKLQKKGEQI